jgi:hypothetical protein
VLDTPETRDPERAYAAPEDKGLAAAITITAQVSQNRSIVVQTYVDRDAPTVELHQLLDKFGKAVDRQEAKLNLEQEKANLETEEKNLLHLKEDFAAIETRSRAQHSESGRKGPWKLSQAEAAQRTNALTNVKRYEEAIAKRKQEIARLKLLIAEGDEPDDQLSF